MLLDEKYQKRSKSFVSSIGGGGPSSYDFSMGTSDNFAQIIIDLVDEKDRDITAFELQDIIREDVKIISGADIEPVHIGGGPPSDAPVGVKIIGSDFSILQDISDLVQYHPVEIIQLQRLL